MTFIGRIHQMGELVASEDREKRVRDAHYSDGHGARRYFHTAL